MSKYTLLSVAFLSLLSFVGCGAEGEADLDQQVPAVEKRQLNTAALQAELAALVATKSQLQYQATIINNQLWTVSSQIWTLEQQCNAGQASEYDCQIQLPSLRSQAERLEIAASDLQSQLNSVNAQIAALQNANKSYPGKGWYGN